MTVIGVNYLIFDIIYIFGKNNSNQYIGLPESESEDDLFPAIRDAVRENRGDILVCVREEQNIRKRLLNEGFRQGADYFFFSEMKEAYVRLCKGTDRECSDSLWELYSKIFYAPHCRFLPCHHPFYEAEITESGEVFTCCSAIMNYNIGSIINEDFNSVWHSAKAKLLRLSVLNGTAVFCSREKCGYLMPCDAAFLPQSEQVSDVPLILNMAIDASCNLSCPSCRNEIKYAGENSVNEKISWINNLDDSLYKDVRHIYVAGNGECMISRVYHYFLMNKVREKFLGSLHLITNGQIFNDDLIGALIEKFCPEILVSVDAWEKETYETLRRGGKHEKMLDVLKKYLEMKKHGKISALAVRFVVQHANYREIPVFIDGMSKLGVDRIEFSRLVNGGAFMAENFENASLLDENGQLKERYVPFFRENVLPELNQNIIMDRAFYC